MLAAMIVLLAAMSSPAATPLDPSELVASNPQPAALGVAMARQCALLPTELACFIYERTVHKLASAQQRVAVDQRLAAQASFVGRYRDAARFNPFKSPSEDTPVAAPTARRGFHAETATDAVARLAQGRRIVMINEYHMDASTRQLTLALLPRLYAEGFRYLAVEALWESGKSFAKRGYVSAQSGYYTREPVFAQLLSQAVKQGYTLVSYDPFGPPKSRESGQAHNIFDKTFAIDPAARVLVHAGHGHIDESPGAFGSDVEPMAMQLHGLTGFDPLTVDQTLLRSHLPDHGPALYQALIRTWKPDKPPVLFDAQDEPWSAAPKVYDVSVLMPVREPGPGRPRWLTLDGKRHMLPIDPAWCEHTWPCEIAAWPLLQAGDAVPADRYAMLKPRAGTHLYLFPGRYRIQARDAGGRLLTSHGANIKETPVP